MKRIYTERFYILSVAVIIILAGIYYSLRIPIELYPNATQTKITVQTHYKSLSPFAFKDRYGDLIEKELNGEGEFEEVDCKYQYEYAICRGKLPFGSDDHVILERVKNKLEPIFLSFPAEWKEAEVNFGDSNKGVLIIALYSKNIPLKKVYDEISPSINSFLSTHPDVSVGEVSNLFEKKISISIKPNVENKITKEMIFNQLSSSNNDIKTIGNISIEGNILSIEASSKLIESLDDLENFKLLTKQNEILKLKDIADVKIIPVEPNELFKGNNQNSLIVWVAPQAKANLVNFSDSIESKVKAEIKRFNGEVTAQTLLNPASFIRNAVKDILYSLIISVILSGIVVFLFLGSLKYSTVINLVMPLSLFGTILFMYILGIEVNLISMGAMAIAIGMVVDASIVVIENIFRHLQNTHPKDYSEKLGIYVKAVSEVKGALFSSTITTICVFVPLHYASPLVSAILGDVATVMTLSLFLSMIMAIFFVPSILLWINPDITQMENLKHKSNFLNRCFTNIQKYYSEAVKCFITNKVINVPIIITLLILFLLSLYLAVYKIDHELIATPTSDIIVFHRGNSKDVDSIATQEKDFHDTEREVFKLTSDYVDFTLTVLRKDLAMMLLHIKNEKYKETLKQLLIKKYKSSEKYEFKVVDWVPTQFEIPDPPQMKVLIGGASPAESKLIQAEVEKFILANSKTVRSYSIPTSLTSDEIIVDIDVEKLGYQNRIHGTSYSKKQILDILNFHAKEKYLRHMKFDGAKTAVFLESDYPKLKREKISSFSIPFGNGSLTLDKIADIKLVKSDSEIHSYNGGMQYEVDAFFSDKGFTYFDEFSTTLIHKFGKEKISTHYPYGLINDTINKLFWALAVSCLLVFLVVFLQYRNIYYTLIILMAIPTSVIGALISLYIFKSTLGMNALLGLILLSGISVNSTIIIIDFYDKIGSDDIADGIVQTMNLRLKPICMTAFTTVIAMVPIAVKLFSGSEALQPLGITISCGLFVSTLLILFIVPWLLYCLPKKRVGKSQL
ncbi:MAG: efflux RND transporter permease subunit [Pseudomonadota bacterium]